MDVKLRTYLAELFGTFLVVLVGAGVVCSASLPDNDRFATVGGVTLGVALAEGAALAVAVTATSYLSLGCCNPAITLTLFVARKLELRQTLGLVAAQLAGSFLAGLVLRGLYADDVLAEARLGAPYLKAALAPGGVPTLAALAAGVALEALFALVVTTAAFATLIDRRAPRLGGLGLGLAQAAVVLIGFRLTGAAANPAGWFGPALWQLSLSLPPDVRPLGDHVVYWLGPVLGALAAGVFYATVVLPPEKE
jgi:aquaporin Z